MLKKHPFFNSPELVIENLKEEAPSFLFILKRNGKVYTQVIKNASKREIMPVILSQIEDWVYHKGITNFASMTNISKKWKEILDEKIHFQTITILPT